MEINKIETHILDEHIPQVKWAQRPKLLLLTICLQDCKSPTIELLPRHLRFHGIGGTDRKKYKVEIEFLQEIIPEKSKFALRDRGVDFVIEKIEEGPYWSRLIKEETKCHWLKINFDKWVDEEEIKESEKSVGAPNFDDMSWNSLMESMRRSSPDGEHPIEKLAKTNESMKYMFEKHQEKLQKETT